MHITEPRSVRDAKPKGYLELTELISSGVMDNFAFTTDISCSSLVMLLFAICSAKRSLRPFLFVAESAESLRRVFHPGIEFSFRKWLL